MIMTKKALALMSFLALAVNERKTENIRVLPFPFNVEKGKVFPNRSNKL